MDSQHFHWTHWPRFTATSCEIEDVCSKGRSNRDRRRARRASSLNPRQSFQRRTLMPITNEEEIAVLYALQCCGGKATKSRVVEFILRNELLQPRPGDEDVVSSGESRIANR